MYYLFITEKSSNNKIMIWPISHPVAVKLKCIRCFIQLTFKIKYQLIFKFNNYLVLPENIKF